MQTWTTVVSKRGKQSDVSTAAAPSPIKSPGSFPDSVGGTQIGKETDGNEIM